MLRVLDASRAYTRRSLDFEIPLVADDETAIEALRQALDSSATEPLATLDALVAGSERHRTAVSRPLQLGVAQALDALTDDFTRRRRPVSRDAAVADALTVIYRVLFLLFAEARGLVPDWHPVLPRELTIACAASCALIPRASRRRRNWAPRSRRRTVGPPTASAIHPLPLGER